MEGPKMPWVTVLNPRLAFGPRPRGRADLRYLVDTLHMLYFVNASPATVADRSAYIVDFSATYAVSVIDWQEPMADAALLLKSVRMLQKHVVLLPRCYIHAETGLCEEAYIGLLLWRLLYPEEAPASIRDWLMEQHKELLFDDDEEKRQLLVDCWKLLDGETEKQRKMQRFGVIMKRPKTE